MANIIIFQFSLRKIYFFVRKIHFLVILDNLKKLKFFLKKLGRGEQQTGKVREKEGSKS